MIKHLVMAAVAVAGVSVVQPVAAQDVGVGVGPAGVGVTVGNGRGDRYRDREVIREREYRDRDETVVIKRKRDYDPDRKVIIEQRERYYPALSSMERPPAWRPFLLVRSIMRRPFVDRAGRVALGVLQPIF